MIRRIRVLAALLACSAVACGDDASGPSVTVEIVPPGSLELLVGDLLELEATLSLSATTTWSSADTAVAGVLGAASVAVVEARRPGSAVVEVRAGDGSDAVTVVVSGRPGGYPAPSIDYYAEIGFGAEYGNATPLVRRWAEGPRVRVNGSPSPDDLATLGAVVSDINRLTTTVDMEIVAEEPSVEIHFASQSSFPGILPSYVPGNVGFFSVWWDGSQSIVRAVVLVSTDIDQVARNHIIREEVTQILGLMRDSYRYPESIFQQSWTLVDRYAAVDEDVIAMLYRPELPVGGVPVEAVRILRRLVRDGPVAVGAGPSPGSRHPIGLPGSASGGHRLR